MTHDRNSETGWDINRRTVLRTLGAASMAGLVGVPAFSGSAVATSHTTETLYLTDSGGDNAGDFLGKLFSVSLDDSGSSPRANLTLLKDFDDSDFGRTAAIAASPDGTTIYMVDANSRHLGTYDVSSGTFSDEGVVSGIPSDDTGVVLAAYSPGGTLYIASQKDNKLYTVDPSGPSATEFVTVSGADVQGADIVFDAAGTLYLYSSSEETLYTVDYTSGSATFGQATEVGFTDDFFTGLAVRAAGTGDLVGSNTTRDEIVVVDKADGSQGTAYEMYFDGSGYAYGYGDMTVGQLAGTTTFELCAGQDTNVGTVTVVDSPDELNITYETTGGWELYETHLDIGDELSDFPTTSNGNPKVGQFDLSGTHDGVTTVTYTVECGDDALSDVDDYSTLFIAAHAVVKPVDGCAEFGEFIPGDSVEGMGTVVPNLDIQAEYGEAVAIKEGTDPRVYRAPNPGIEDDQDPVKNWGVGLAKSNGVGSGGFSDAKASTDNEAHSYTFSFEDGVTATDFSLRMMDYGDYNPTSAKSHYAEMVAYDENGNPVDKQVLDYNSNGERVSPVIEEDVNVNNGLTEGDDLVTDGDAYSTVNDDIEADLGRYTWQMSGDGITRIELNFGEGFDPDFALDNLCFTANDETAWPCEPQDAVESFTEKGNWATYLTYDTSLLDC